jgi:hypothetical protein
MAEQRSRWFAIGAVVLVPILILGGWRLIYQSMSEPTDLGLTSIVTSEAAIPIQSSFVEHLTVTIAAGAADADGTGSIELNASGPLTVSSFVNDADGSRATTSSVSSLDLSLTILPCKAGSSCIGHYTLTLQNTGAAAVAAEVKLIYRIPYYAPGGPPGRSLVVGLDP